LEHIDDITTLAFQAIKLVNQQGVKPWIHNEMQQINDLNFRFSEKGRPSNEVVSLAGNLQNYPAHLVIKGPYISESFSAQRVETILADLNYTKLRQIIVAPGLLTDKTEPYYNTAYSIKPLSAEQIKHWQQVGLHQQLTIPAANPFIPERTDVRSRYTHFDNGTERLQGMA
jgi:secreted Zn-dependent insulinase-like peptidase